MQNLFEEKTVLQYMVNMVVFHASTSNFKLSHHYFRIQATPMNAKLNNVFYDVIIKILTVNAALFILLFYMTFEFVIFVSLNIFPNRLSHKVHFLAVVRSQSRYLHTIHIG